jgi:hypothetical protein
MWGERREKRSAVRGVLYMEGKEDVPSSAVVHRIVEGVNESPLCVEEERTEDKQEATMVMPLVAAAALV